METIEVKKENADLAIKAAYAGAPIAEVLAILFRQKVKAGPALERIFTFEDACLDQGYQPDDSRFTGPDPFVNDTQKLRLVVIPALREGWVPNYNDIDQGKWSGYYYMNDPGFRFYDARYVIACSVVGSWLVLPSPAHEEHLAKYFLPILKNHYCPPVQTNKHEDLPF